MPVVTDYTALLSGSYWNGIEATGSPVIVTYSFPTTLPSYDTSIPGITPGIVTPFNAAEQQQAHDALAQWASASGLVFLQVAPGKGDINFQLADFSSTPYAGAGGIGFYPFGNWNSFSYPNFFDDLDSSGEIFMNSQYATGGTVNFGTLLHEIGHAIGLKHPTEDVYDSAAGVDHNQVLSSDDPTRTIMATVGDGSSGTTAQILTLDQNAAAAIYGPAGTGGVYTTSQTGTNSVSKWSWNATTQTLTQTAVTSGETIRGSSVNDIINGSAGNDRLFGLAGDDQIYAGAGDDSLYGGSGTNMLVGGTGNDSYYVSSSTDTIVENANEGQDSVYATVSFTLPSNVESLSVFGSGLTATGNAQGDSLFGDGTFGSILVGGAGQDYMVGGLGDDLIEGGGGTDQMYGGGGADTFVFKAVTDAPPGGTLTTIGDFVQTQDKIDLSAIKIVGGANAGQPLNFIGSAAFSHHAGEVHQVTSGSNTIIEGDVNGDGIADFQIQLFGNYTLQASDFILAPGTLISTRTNVLTNTSSWSILGTSSSAAAGDNVSIVSNGAATAIGSAAFQSNGSFSVPVVLTSQGDNILVANVTSGGNTVASSNSVDYAYVTQGTYTNTRVTSVNGFQLMGTTVVQNQGTINETGGITIGDASGSAAKLVNLTGGIYNLVGDVGIAVGTNTGSLFNNAGGTLAKTSGSGTSVVAASFTDGTSAASKIVVNSGTLQFMGATDNVVAQTISGAGTFGIGAGSATIGTGTAITTAGFAVSGSGTQVKLGENLTYGGSYSQSGSAGLNLAGFGLALKGSASIVGAGGSGGYAGISGGGTATLSGTSTLGNLIVGGATALTNTSTGTMTTSGQVLLGGTSSLTNSGTINQGGTVTVGDASGSLAKLVNLTGGTYNLVGDVGIGIGANTGASFNNAGGTLAKTSGTGKSVVAVSVFDGNGAAGQIKIASGALQLNGPNNTLTAQTISGPGTLLFGTNTYNQIGAGTTITAGAVSMIGTGGTFKLGEDLGYGGNFSVLNNSVINLGSYGLTLSGTTSLVGAGTGNYASVSGSGTLTLSGTTTIGNFSILNSVQVVNTGTVTQTINVGIGDSGNQAAKVTNAAGATWTIASDGVLAGTTASSFVNAGTLVKTASTGYTQVTANFVTSAASPNAITINSGTMQFKGSTSAFVASTISGAGSFQILGGAATIGAGTSIATASFGLSGSGTSVTLGENLSYGNKFTDGGATLNLGSNTLSLSGSAGFTSASVTGTGVLSVSGSTTVSGLSVGGSATLQNSAGGVVTQSGTVTLGDSTNGAATLTDAGTWRISADVGIAAGGTASSLNVAGGTLTKTGGTGTSLIGVAVGNSGSAAGTIEASSGTLEFGGTVSGAENLLADANTTMIFDQSVGTGSAFVYHGANATLQLNDAQDFHGTIGSFAAGETLDLRSILFGSTSSSPSYSGTASGGTLTVSDGTHTASLAFLGNYTTANFHAASDNHGGTLFTFA